MAPSALLSSTLLLVLCTCVSVGRAQIRIFNLRASNLPADLMGTTDAYVKVFCGPAALGKTSTRNNDANPWWDEEFTFFQAEQNNVLRLDVYDSDIIFDDLVGTCQRQVKVGTHQHECFLKKGGSLHYTYTLSGSGQ